MKKYLFALFLGLYAIDCMAAVDAQISASQAGIDDVLILTITSSDTSSAQPDLTPLRDMFEVVSSSVSHQTSIINGRMSSQNIWKIGLKALQTGKLVIPPLTVGTQKTAPIDVVITNTPSAIAAPVQNSQAVAQTDSPLYALSAELKTDAAPFIGEQMRYFVTLTDDGTIEDGAPSFEPTTDFIIKSLGNPQVQTLGNGKRQITFAFAIFSLKSGKVKIPTVYFKGYAYQKPDVDNVFGGGFFNIRMPSVFGLQTPVNLAFEGPEIDIRPAVADYHGPWWLPATNVTLTANFIDMPQTLTEGMPLVREITLEAQGLTDTQLPELRFDNVKGFKVYAEKPTGETTIHNNTLVGIQKTRVTYIPNASGPLVLDAVTVPWFDLTTGQVKEAVLERQVLDIQPNPNLTEALPKQNAKQAPSLENVKTLSETSLQNPYITAAIAFIIGLVAAMVFLRPRKAKNPAPKKENVDYLKNIEHQKDIKKLRDDIILWARQHYTTQNISNLQDVADLLNNDDFTRQVQQLNTALYDQNSPHNFDRKNFIRVFKRALKSAPKKKTSDPLPPLYKI